MFMGGVLNMDYKHSIIRNIVDRMEVIHPIKVEVLYRVEKEIMMIMSISFVKGVWV